MPGDVVGGPSEHERGRRVDARRREDGAKVGDAWAPGVREEDDVPDHGDGDGAHDERRTETGALRGDGHREGEDESYGVGRHGEELSLRGGVAELFDDGGLVEGGRG